MKKKQQQPGAPAGEKGKEESNAGSTSFNQGSAQDPSYDDGVQVTDEEKKTGHAPNPATSKNSNKLND